MICCFLCHCGSRQTDRAIWSATGPDNEAAQLKQAILGTNARIDTIKGIGFVKISQDDQSNTFRAAWIGSRPQRFRLEILSATGQPVLSFASDGKRHYLLSYSDNRLYRRKASENGLERLISIAVSPGEILDLLSGRLPVHPDSMAAIERYDGNGEPVLMLKAPNRGEFDRIYPGTTAGAAFYRIERYDRRGGLEFSAVFEKVREVDGMRIPEVLTVSNGKGATIRIEIERCWVNPALSEDRFVLKTAD